VRAIDSVITETQVEVDRVEPPSARDRTDRARSFLVGLIRLVYLSCNQPGMRPLPWSRIAGRAQREIQCAMLPRRRPKKAS